MSVVSGCCFGIRFFCCVANFVILCIIWSNLDDIKQDYDKILSSYSDDVSFYVLSSNDFWGPVTVLCDETSWNNSINNNNTYFGNVSNVTDMVDDADTSDDTINSCKEFMDEHFNDLDTTQEYFSLYWLTPSEERNNVSIDYFADWREFVYVFAIISSLVTTLVSCCIGCNQTAQGFGFDSSLPSGPIGMTNSSDDSEGGLIQTSIGAFIIDYFGMIYTMIICNSLSMIPMTNEYTQGHIILMDYLPDWGLFIALMCSLVSPCAAICSKVLCNSKKNPCFLTIMFCLFSFPMMGLAFYMLNFSQEYSYLIKEYKEEHNASSSLISNHYIDTTETLSQLAIIVFSLTWSQMVINICACVCYVFGNRTTSLDDEIEAANHAMDAAVARAAAAARDGRTENV